MWTASLEKLRANYCRLDRCLPWLVKAVRTDLPEWIIAVVNASFGPGQWPFSCKEVVIHSLLKKSSLHPSVLNNYQPASNISFWGKVVKQAVASWIQGFLDETDYLAPGLKWPW